jgi:hypothetical protein
VSKFTRVRAGYYDSELFEITRTDDGFWRLVRKPTPNTSGNWVQDFNTLRDAREAVEVVEYVKRRHDAN